MTSKTDCHKCKFYYVTWDKNFPHGCNAMGFKSKNIPSIEVYKNSSFMECQFYNEKIIEFKKQGVSR